MTSFSEWVHAKTEVRSKTGMVVARHPRSAQAGLEVLLAGGNAADAAIAASFAASVVQPVANTIGGGGLLTVFRDGEARSVNYHYQSPAAARPDMFEMEGSSGPGLFGWSGVKNQANEFGHRSVAIPGSVAGLVAAQKSFGRLPLQKVLQPAIQLAEDGFEMDWYGSLMLGGHLDILQRFPTTAQTFLRGGVHPYRPRMVEAADVFRQPMLARTLNDISIGGANAYYRGDAAQALVSEMERGHGLITMRDLAGYEARHHNSPSIRYREHRIYGVHRSGALLFQALQTLEHFDLPKMEPDDPIRIHLIVEALRRAWANQGRFDADSPDDTGWDSITSRQYGEKVAATIDTKRRTDFTNPPWSNSATPSTAPAQGNTVHISVADGTGMLVSLTETVLGNYGSGVTTDAGVLLNNGMMAFTPVPGTPTSIAPGKRPWSNMSPLVVLSPAGAPFAALGASGGRRIVSAVLQILTLLIDHRLGMQAAVAYPRVDIIGDGVILDWRLGEGLASHLGKMGHPVERRTEDLSTFQFGNACGILIGADGNMTSGANPFQMTAAAGV